MSGGFSSIWAIQAKFAPFKPGIIRLRRPSPIAGPAASFPVRNIPDEQRHIDNQFWMVVFPGSTIAVVVFAVNFLGDGLRDVMDPKLRGRWTATWGTALMETAGI